MSQSLVGMDLARLREALGSDQPAYRAKQVYEAIYRGRATDLADISALPAALRESLNERLASMSFPISRLGLAD
jgi:23S rRNA (adenine2503-C2)-methyltransferase